MAGGPEPMGKRQTLSRKECEWHQRGDCEWRPKHALGRGLHIQRHSRNQAVAEGELLDEVAALVNADRDDDGGVEDADDDQSRPFVSSQLRHTPSETFRRPLRAAPVLLIDRPTGLRSAAIAP